MDPQCDQCGSVRLEDAQLEGVAIRPDRAALMKKIFNVGGVVKCRVCLDCGAISDLRGDPKKLVEMVPP
jgi:hypothetical protein